MANTPSTSGLDPRLVQACSSRLEEVRGALDAAGLDGLIVRHDKDIQYLTGFVGDDTVLLITTDAAHIITDARHDEMLDPWRPESPFDVVMGVRHRLEKSVAEIASTGGLRRLGVQSDHLTQAQYAKIVEALPSLGEKGLVGTVGIVDGLRVIKDDLEVEAISAAIDLQEEAMLSALAQLTTGMSETELAALIEYEMKRRGARQAGFNSIVGSGHNSSLIHYITADSSIGEGVLLIDWGAQLGWYNGDLTRTFGVGSLSPRMRELYDVVLEAQLAAIDGTQPGMRCCEIDAIARKVIDQAGYGEYFGHGLGHGLGIDVHEDPYFNNLDETVLKPGMVMTYEPGIYLPGEGGVRIEDDVLITESGTRVMSSYPKDPDDAILDIGVKEAVGAGGKSA